MPVRRTTLLALLVVVAAGAAACGGDDDGASPPAAAAGKTETVVTVKTFQFDPDPITVEAGVTVRFVNEDSTTHTATAGTREAPDPERFDVELTEDGMGEVTLDEPGTYAYFCTIHDGPGMTAQIIVT